MSTAAPPRNRPRATDERWRSSPPAQKRSRETADRFAAAAEQLLRDRPFEEITIQDLVRRTGRPIGSFYARFASKEALLPVLYERYHDGLEAVVVTRLARIEWAKLDFPSTVAALVDFLLGLYTERRWLIRALALFTRMRPEALPTDVVARRRRVYDHAIEILMPHRTHILHANPEAAIRFGVYMVSCVAREKLLFVEAPLSRVTPMTRKALRDELVRTLHAYLAAEPPR